jgi:hypothetical protein
MPLARRLLLLMLVGAMVFAPLGSVRAVPAVQPGSVAFTANGPAADFFDCAHDSSPSTVCLGQCGSTSACAVMTGKQALPIPLTRGAKPVSFYLISVGTLCPPESQPPKALLHV